MGIFRDSIVTTETHGEENGTESNRELGLSGGL